MSDQQHIESFDFDPTKPETGFSEPSYEGTINQYKEALELLKKEYTLVEKKLVDKEEEIEHLMKVLASANGGKDTHNFELINQTYELRSEINKLKYNVLEEKEVQEKMRLEYEERIEELENQVTIRVKQLNELADEMTSQKKKDLVKELEEKAMEFMREIQDLEAKNFEIQEENSRLKEEIVSLQQQKFQIEKQKLDNSTDKAKYSDNQNSKIESLQQELTILQQKFKSSQQKYLTTLQQLQKSKSLLTVSQQNSHRLLLKTKQQQIALQNNELLSKDKVSHASEQLDRVKKLGQKYKQLIAEKDQIIKRSNDKILILQMQKTKTGKTENQAIAGYIIKIKQLNQQNADVNLKIKRLQATHNDQISDSLFKTKRLETEIKQKDNTIEQLKSSLEQKQTQYKSQITLLKQNSIQIEQQLKKKNTQYNDLNISFLKAQKQSSFKIRLLEEKIIDLNEELEDRQVKLQEITQNTMTKGSKKQLTQQDDLKLKIQGFKQQLKQKSAIERQLQNVIDGLKQEAETHEQEIERQREQRKKSQNEVINLQKNIKQLTKQLSNIKQLSDRSKSQKQQTSQQFSLLITQLKQDLTRERDRTKGKQQQIITARTDLNKVNSQNQLLKLRLDEAGQNQKIAVHKNNVEKQLNKKSIDRLNNQIENLKKQLAEIKKNEIHLREEIYNENEKYSNVLAQFETTRLKLIEGESVRKRLQQSEDSLKRKVQQGLTKLSQYQVQLEDKSNGIKQQQRKAKEQKDRLNVKIKRFEQDRNKSRQLQLQNEQLKIKLIDIERQLQEKQSNKQKELLLYKRSSGLDRQRERQRQKDNTVSSAEVNRLKRNNQSIQKQNDDYRRQIETLEQEISELKKQHGAIKRELNSQKKASASNVQKIDQLNELNRELQENYDNVLREKMQLNQQKNNQIRKLQAEIEQLHSVATVSKIDRLQLKSNPVSQNQIGQLKIKIKSLQHKLQQSDSRVQQLEQKLRQIEDQKSLLQNKIQIFKLQGGQKKKQSQTSNNEKKLQQQLQSIKQRQQQLQLSYKILLQQHQQLKDKNSGQVSQLQEKIKQMNEVLIAQKKEYQLKNVLKFQEQTSAYNQLNKANQLLEEETQKFRSQKSALEAQIMLLNKKIGSLEGTVKGLKQQNVKLIESNQVDDEAENLHRRLSNLTRQMEDLKESRNHVPEKSRTDLNYISELEQRCREIQRDNQRMLDFNAIKTQSLVMKNHSSRDNYSQLMEDYNELVKTNKYLQQQRGIKRSRQTSRPVTHYQFYHSETDNQLKNVYKQVQILNNIIMDKDYQIQSLKKITSTRIIPTPDLPRRLNSPARGYPPMSKKASDTVMSASGSQRLLKPVTSLRSSNLM